MELTVTLQSAENARLWRSGVPGGYFRHPMGLFHPKGQDNAAKPSC